MELNAKKRRRSDDGFSSGPQTKLYVNQQIRDKNDTNAMKKIHDKTVGKLFEGARNLENNNGVCSSHVNTLCILSGNGVLQFIDEDKDRKLFATYTKTKTKCCIRDAYVSTDCTDCNQKICEHCGYSCIGCLKYLCTNCILRTNSGSIDNPLCDFCKLFK